MPGVYGSAGAAVLSLTTCIKKKKVRCLTRGNHAECEPLEGHPDTAAEKQGRVHGDREGGTSSSDGLFLGQTEQLRPKQGL